MEEFVLQSHSNDRIHQEIKKEEKHSDVGSNTECMEPESEAKKGNILDTLFKVHATQQEKASKISEPSVLA